MSLIAVLAMSQAASASTGAVTVNSTGDMDARDGAVTLREAILLATGVMSEASLDSSEAAQVTGIVGGAEADTIRFDPLVFPSGAPGTIELVAPLPPLSTGSDTVDGSMAGVEIHGHGHDCLVSTAADNAIYGLTISGCDRAIAVDDVEDNIIGGPEPGQGNVLILSGYGIWTRGAGGVQIQGNFIGTDATGVTSLPNGTGLWLYAHGALVGGSAPGEGNVISGNTGHGVAGDDANRGFVVGNLIGVTADGTAPLGNGGAGIAFGTENSYGMTIEGNVVSGNGYATGEGAIRFQGHPSEHIVRRNMIGTDVTGTVAIPNHGDGITYGAATSGTLIERNVISGNLGNGLSLSPYSLCDRGTDRILNNRIGTDITGQHPLGNSGHGIEVREGCNIQIGEPGNGNSIAANGGHGIALLGGPDVSGTMIRGNWIGTDEGGTSPLGNGGHGVFVNGWTGTVIGGLGVGEKNVIAYNGTDGISVDGFIPFIQVPTTLTFIRANSISENSGRGIEIGTPEKTVPPAVRGVSPINGSACPFCTVDVFSDTADEGQSYLGSVVADAVGVWSLDEVPAWSNVTATATSPALGTSEFSEPFAVNLHPAPCSASIPTIVGTEGGDVLVGTDGPDIFLGLGGSDRIYGLGGDDLICAGEGDDIVYGGAGNDTIYGEGGEDYVHADDGHDYLDGGAARDQLHGDGGDDTILGGEGPDRIYGGAGDDALDGGSGDDVAYGGDGDDHLTGGEGNDRLKGDSGDDTLDGGAGNDTLVGDSAQESTAVPGHDGNDVLLGGDGDDDLHGRGGDDSIYGGDGNDRVYAGPGDDTIYGGGGQDSIRGQEGDNYCDGGENFDYNSSYDCEWSVDIYPNNLASGTGRLLTFERGSSVIPGWTGGISVVNAVGTGLSALTDYPTPVSTRVDQTPSISQDGSLVAFVSSRWDGAWTHSIYTIGSDASGETEIIQAAPQSTVIHPAISPDGMRIAYTRTISGDYDVFVANIDGTAPQNVTQSFGAYEEFPCWSRDGNHLFFVSEGDVWRIGEDGSGRVRLTDDTRLTHFIACSRTDGRLLRASVADGGTNVYRVDVIDTGTGTSTTAAEIPDLGGLSWAPETDHFLYTQHAKMVRLSLDGISSTSLVSYPAGPIGSVRWNQ